MVILSIFAAEVLFFFFCFVFEPFRTQSCRFVLYPSKASKGWLVTSFSRLRHIPIAFMTTQSWSKWRRSWPCFREFRTSIFFTITFKRRFLANYTRTTDRLKTAVNVCSLVLFHSYVLLSLGSKQHGVPSQPLEAIEVVEWLSSRLAPASASQLGLRHMYSQSRISSSAPGHQNCANLSEVEAIQSAGQVPLFH